MFYCLSNCAKDVVRTVAVFYAFSGALAIWTCLGVLRQFTQPASVSELFQEAWCPCSIIICGALLFVIGMQALSTCCLRRDAASAPFHLFTGATLVMLPMELAAAALVAEDGPVLRSIEESDKTGTLTTVLDFIRSNPGPSVVGAATIACMQAAAVLAGLWLALCPAGRPSQRPRPMFDQNAALGSPLHVPLLRQGRHRRGESVSSGILTPRGGPTGVRTPPAIPMGSPRQAPTIVLTTGGETGV